MAWAAAFGWHLAADATVSPVVQGAVAAGFTQFGCWLLVWRRRSWSVPTPRPGSPGPEWRCPGSGRGSRRRRSPASSSARLWRAWRGWAASDGLVAFTNPDGTVATAVIHLTPMLARMLVATTLSAVIGVAWTVLLGYRHRITILAVFVWPVVIERILSAIAPADLGAYLAPYRSLAYYVSGYGVGLPYPYPPDDGWQQLVVFTGLLCGGAHLAHRIRTRSARCALDRPNPTTTASAPAVRMRTVVAHALRAELRRVPIGRVVGRWLVAPLISTLAGAGAVGLVVAASASSPTPLEAPADIVLMGFTMVGLVFIVVSAASMYLGEHGSGALLDVYRCLPQRRVALLAKLVWTAMLASGTTAVAVTSTLSSYAVLGPQGAASAPGPRQCAGAGRPTTAGRPRLHGGDQPCRAGAQYAHSHRDLGHLDRHRREPGCPAAGGGPTVRGAGALGERVLCGRPQRRTGADDVGLVDLVLPVGSHDGDDGSRPRG